MPGPKRVSHEDRLSIVDHLDELRGRIIVAVVTFSAAWGLCLWQNHLILHLLNKPLHGREPITLGVGEPFSTTLTVSAYAALVIALPVLLYQVYAFVLPAFTPSERRVALPLLLMVPVLFVAGVTFGYLLILPKAVQFLQSFNSDEFQTQVRAKDYYSFVSMSLIAVGVLFQIPVGILATTKLGITSPAMLRKNRRYAILLIAVIAMLLPGQDPVTMVIAMLPLVVLYELSILLAVFVGRPRETALERADPPDPVAPAEGS